MRILATADLHLGLRFAGYGSFASAIAADRFDALGRYVDLANDKGVDLFVIAGDLFDRRNVPAADVKKAAQTLNRFSGQAVVVLPGNHDYAVADADPLWDRFSETAGDAVYVATSPGVWREFSADVALYAAPCNAQHSSTHRLDEIAPSDGDQGAKYRILVAHGSIAGLTPDEDGVYFPMTTNDVRAVGADLSIIGHTHVPVVDQDAGLVVPGTHVPDGFHCSHDGGVTIVELAERSGEPGTMDRPGETGAGSRPAIAATRRVSLPKFRFADRAVTFSVGQDPASELHGLVSESDTIETILRLTASGRLTTEELAAFRRAVDELRARTYYFELRDEELLELLSREEVGRRFSSNSFAHRLLTDLMDNNDEEALAAALELMGETGDA